MVILPQSGEWKHRVMPANAGIQGCRAEMKLSLDSGLRRNDFEWRLWCSVPIEAILARKAYGTKK
jgi:hypothetical protein